MITEEELAHVMRRAMNASDVPEEYWDGVSNLAAVVTHTMLMAQELQRSDAEAERDAAVAAKDAAETSASAIAEAARQSVAEISQAMDDLVAASEASENADLSEWVQSRATVLSACVSAWERSWSLAAGLENSRAYRRAVVADVLREAEVLFGAAWATQVESMQTGAEAAAALRQGLTFP